LVGIFMRKG